MTVDRSCIFVTELRLSGSSGFQSKSWTSAHEDQKGLRLEGKLTLETQRGAEARALAKDGALALSIGYQTQDADWIDGKRILKEVKLFEVSLVSIPMNPEVLAYNLTRVMNIMGVQPLLAAIRA
jgi:HK97 family phage prohead protease